MVDAFLAWITLYGSLYAHKYVALLNCCNTARHTDIGCIYRVYNNICVDVLWTVGLARVFIRGHTTVATLTLHDRADVVGLVIRDEILYIYKLSERKKEFNRDVHMDVMYKII